MRSTTALFFIALFVTVGCLIGGLRARHPLHNFAAVITLWLIYYLVTNPYRRKRQYRRERRQLEEHCMRLYLSKNKFRY